MSAMQIDAKANRVSLTLDEKVYPRQVNLAAAYRFIDRCYVRLERSGRKGLTVWLKGKRPLKTKALQSLADEFHNELLQQLMRHQLAERTQGIREAIVGRALQSAAPLPAQAPPPELVDTDALDYTEDPLGIAVPWEEKYGEPEEEN